MRAHNYGSVHYLKALLKARIIKRRLGLVAVIFVLLLIAGSSYKVYAWQHKKDTDLNSKVDNLNQQVNSVNQQVSSLNTQISGLNQQISDLKSVNSKANSSAPKSSASATQSPAPTPPSKHKKHH